MRMVAVSRDIAGSHPAGSNEEDVSGVSYLKYETTGGMRVTVNIADTANASLPVVSFPFSDSQPDWTPVEQSFTAPEKAAFISITFASGGGLDTTGTAYLDDISLVNETGVPEQPASKARVIQAAYAPSILIDGTTNDWAGLAGGILAMDTQGRGNNGAMGVDIQYAWDATNLYVLVRENTSKYTATLKQEAADAAAYQDAPWSVDTIGFWIDLGNDAGTTVDGSIVSEPNADFQPWFGFSSTARTDLMYARVNNSGTINLDALANTRVATGGAFARHDRFIEAALPWADMALSVDTVRQPGGDLLSAITPGFTFGCEPLLIYHDFNSQAFLGPDQWNAPNGVDTNSVDIQLEEQTVVPSLSVSRTGAQLKIQWPVAAVGYTLESTAKLGTGASWAAITATQLTDGTMNTMILTADGLGAFYRLRK